MLIFVYTRVIESLKAGRRLPEARFATATTDDDESSMTTPGMLVGASGRQRSVYGMIFQSGAPATNSDGGGEGE